MEKKYTQLQKLKTTQGRFKVRKSQSRTSNNLSKFNSSNVYINPIQITNYIILGILGTLANAFFKLFGKATIKNRANVHTNTIQ